MQSIEVAKITSKGQITIPVSVRRQLSVDYGDKVVFYEAEGKVFIAKATADSLKGDR